MAKLQLYITIAYKGYKEMLDINADTKAKENVTNLSHVMGKIKYKTANINIFFMLKYTADGVFLTVLRTIPALKPDHLAAWIFIPYDMKISNAEIEEVVDSVIKAISNSKITSETYAELCKLFEKEYDTIPLAGAIAPNRGTQMAYRYYGDITGYILSDLIGSKRYQTSYLPFSEVVLADKTITQEINGESLTDEPLDQMVKLFPPMSPDPAFRPTIFGCEFDKPYLTPLMGTVEIRWMKGNSPAAVQSVMVNRPNLKPDSVAIEELIPIQPLDAPQPSASTNAVKEHSQISGSDVAVTQQPNQSPATPVPPGAPTAHDTNGPTATQQKEHSANPGPITARTTAFSGKISGFFKTLSSDPYARIKAIWALIGFVAGVLLTMMCTCMSNHNSGSDADESEQAADSVAVQQPGEVIDLPGYAESGTDANQQTTRTEKEAPSLTAAVAYLDGYKTWTRTELEKYPDLKGLYDDLNNFNKQRLVSYWGPKLKNSKRFGKIVEHSRQAIKRAKKPRVPEGQKTFNKAGRTVIKVQTYLNTIDP